MLPQIARRETDIDGRHTTVPYCFFLPLSQMNKQLRVILPMCFFIAWRLLALLSCQIAPQKHAGFEPCPVHSRAFSFMRQIAAFASPALAVGATPRGTKGTIEVIFVPTASVPHGCLQPSTWLRRRTVAAPARRRAVGRPPTWCAARGRAARPRACPAPRSSRRQCAGPTVSAVDCRD